MVEVGYCVYLATWLRSGPRTYGELYLVAISDSISSNQVNVIALSKSPTHVWNYQSEADMLAVVICNNGAVRN